MGGSNRFFVPPAVVALVRGLHPDLKAKVRAGLDAIRKNPDAEGLFVTTPFLPDKAGPMAAKFIDAYKRVYGKEPNWFAANTYDAVGMAADAIKAVGLDRVKIQAYLAGINSPDNAFVGVTGKTYFDENGDCLKAAFIKEIKGGKWASSKQQMQ